MKTLALALSIAALTAGAALAQGGGAHFLENWDIDGDGKLTLDEARQKRGEIFYMFDHDENGTLDAAEYDEFDGVRAADMQANGMVNAKASPANGLKREFNDADKDGAVTRQEFLDGTDAWYGKIDRNGDGTVDLDDFPRGGN